MIELEDLPREQLEQMSRDPLIGDVLKERIFKLLRGAAKVRKELQAIRVREIAAPVTITIPWSALASDNLRKGVAGANNREKQARYRLALVRFREIVRECNGDAPYAGPLGMLVLFWFPDNRDRDPWNFQKEILDGLKGIAIVDDKWQELRRVTFEAAGIDVDRPRCEITINRYTARANG